MLKPFRLTLVALLLCALTACSSTTTDPTEDPEVKMKTAKINAQLGLAYLDRHNIQRSKQKLLLALDQGPNIPEPYYSMGYFYEATGDDAMANKFYLQAIRIAPQRGDVHNNYGTYLCRKQEYRKSIEQFVLAAQDPDYLSPGDAYENAGLCALRIPDKALAYQNFKRALQLNPERMVSLRELNKLDNRVLAEQRPKSRMKTMSDYLKTTV